MVCNQAITAGMSGVILDINFDAVFRVMDLYEVEDRRKVFEKVVAAFRKCVIEKQKEKQEHGIG